MQKNKQDKTFSDYIRDIDTKAHYLEKYPEEAVSKTATDIISDLAELKKGLKGIRSTLLFLILIIIMSIGFAIFSLTNYKNIRSILINDNQAKKDSLLDIYSSDDDLRYRSEKGKIVTYNQLATENDTLLSRYYQMKSDLEICKIELKSSKSNTDFYKGNAKYYEDIYDKKSSNDLNQITNQVKNIEKVDSGKVLLEVFRKNMKYDSKTKSWTIDLNKSK